MTDDPAGAGPAGAGDATGDEDLPGTGPPAGPGRGARGDGIPPDEEPTTTGTLFIMVLFLMAMGAMWGLMYFTLLNR